MTLDHILHLAGILIPAASALASFINHAVREKMNAQPPEPVPAWLAGASAALNAIALNGDKAVQMAKLFRGGR